MTTNTSKPVSHYLHPDYLDPLPTNVMDPKQSPLALLAQTCNNIGKDGTVGGASLPQKDQNANNKPSLQHSPSPTATTVSAKVSPAATVPATQVPGTVICTPVAKRKCVEDEDKPSSTSIERESPSSTCKSTNNAARTTPHKRSAPSSPKRQPLSPRSVSSPTAADSAGVAKSAIASAAMVPPHSLFQLKSSGFLPDLGHPTSLHAAAPPSTGSTSAAAAAAAAAAFGLPGGYGQYSAAAAAAAAAGLPWAGLLPPPTHGAGSCHDPQCTQCPSSHHRPGSSSCTCSHCSTLHAKSMADYYHALVQSGILAPPAPTSSAATSPGSKANAEFCMYCGKHCPTLEELLTHMRTHDSPSAAAAVAAAAAAAGPLPPPPPFGLYPSSTHCPETLSPDSLRKAWSYASMASRFHPYRGLMSTRMPHHSAAAFSNFGAPLV